MDTPQRTRLLLVEDDLRLAGLMCEFLESRGEFRVEKATDGIVAVQRIQEAPPDLVVLDIMLPGIDGLEVCRRVRPFYNGPVLMLTALGDEIDEIVGLEVGADDYLAKPVSPRLLLTRIRALLRRTSSNSGDTAEVPPPPALGVGAGITRPVVVGSLVVDPAARVVTWHGAEVVLTTAEFDLLFLLARHAGEVVPREEIYRQLRGFDWDGLDRSVDQRIRRLRERLGDDARMPRLIKSVRGTGYLLAVTE